MDKLYNIQQIKECFGQQTKFYILLQAENNIPLKYTPMEEPTECNGQEDNNFVFYHGTGEQDDPIQID